MLAEIIDQEKAINLPKIQDESQKLIVNLQVAISNKGMKEDKDGLMAKLELFRNQKISPFSFYSYLKDLALKHLKEGAIASNDMAGYPHLNDYITYLTKVNSLDQVKLFNELGELTYEVKLHIASNDKEKTLVTALHNINFLESFFNLKVSNEELGYYLNNKDEHKVAWFKSAIKTVDQRPKTKNQKTYIDYNPDLIDKKLPILEEFYKIVKARDLAMVENALSEIEKRNASVIPDSSHVIPAKAGIQNNKVTVAALIAGGFHTKGITTLLREKNYSYIVISPYSKTDIDEENYHFLLSGRRRPITELINQLDLPEIVNRLSTSLRIASPFDTDMYEGLRQDVAPVLAEIWNVPVEELTPENILERIAPILALHKRAKIWQLKAETIVGIEIKQTDKGLIMRILPQEGEARYLWITTEGAELAKATDFRAEGETVVAIGTKVGREIARAQTEIMVDEVTRGPEKGSVLKALESLADIEKFLKEKIITREEYNDYIQNGLMKRSTFIKIREAAGQMGEEIGWSVRTADREIADFKRLGIIEQKQVNGKYIVRVKLTLEQINALPENITLDLNRGSLVNRGSLDNLAPERIAEINRAIVEKTKEIGGIEQRSPPQPAVLANKHLVWLEEINRHDTAIAGGKGANLGELWQNGVRVPYGFVVTAKAFQDTLIANKAHEEIQRILQGVDVSNAVELEQAAVQIQTLIKSFTLPVELADGIRQYHRELADKLGISPDAIRVAVRSSATAEDRELSDEMKRTLGTELTSGSSAGQQTTYLNVRPEDVLSRVIDDYASLFNSNAISYRDTQGLIDFLVSIDQKSRAELEQKLLQNAATQDIGERLRTKQHASRVRLRRAIEQNMPILLEQFDRAYDPYVNPKRLSLAAVVQHMIHSERAFTIFSLDNRTGWTGLSFQKENLTHPTDGRVFRLDANYGLGESVVQGIVNPDTWLIHIFTDKQGQVHVNILEKTIGTKKLQVTYIDSALGEIGLTEDEAMKVVELVKAFRAGDNLDILSGEDRFKEILQRLHISTADIDHMVQELERVITLAYDTLDNYRIPAELSGMSLNNLQFIRLAHLAKARLDDPRINTMETFIAAEMRSVFSMTDEEVKELALSAKRATDFYGSVRDMEGAKEGGKALAFVQSRAITTDIEINQPALLQLRKTVVNEAAAAEAEQQGGLLAVGVPGRNAVVGEIVLLVKDSKEPYEEQLKRAQDRAVELAPQSRRIVLRTGFTTPQDEPAMKVAGGVVADEGGDTSHAAIVSRELKIATVVGISEYLAQVKRDDPSRYAQILEHMNTPGNVVTVDANAGKVYKKGELPLELQEVEIDVTRLPKLRFTKPGLIMANPQTMREFSKVALYDSYYGISLARAEFILVSIGIHPRAIEAYDNMKALEGDTSYTLTERERRDVEILKGNPKLIQAIEDKIHGYPSAKEYYIQKMYGGIASMAAANGLHQKVLYRFNDFKQNELNKITGGQEFGLIEEASMIGDRGTGWLLKEENRTALGMEMEALRRAYEAGYTNVGAFFAFVRTPDELREGLSRFEELDMPLDTVGMMVELPPNVIQAHEFGALLAEYAKRTGKHVFFSFGTNDLTQLTRVAGREEPFVKELFSEANPAVVGSLRHVVKTVVAMRQKYNVDFTCGLCGQAIIKLIDSDPVAAREIASMLDSTGLDILGFLKTVKMLAEAELDLSVIPETAKNTAQEIARAKSSQNQGAASRRLVTVRQFNDLAKVYLGDFLVLDPNFALDLGRDLPAVDWKAMQLVLERVQRESFDAQLKQIAAEIKASLPKDETERQRLMKDVAFRERYARFLILETFDRAGAVITNVKSQVDMTHIPMDSPTAGIQTIIELYQGKAVVKPRIAIESGYEDMANRDGAIVTIDFSTGHIYDGELELVKTMPQEKDIIEIIEKPAQPKQVNATFVSAGNVYRELKMHPLALIRDGGKEVFKEAVRRAISSKVEEARTKGQRLVYQTSDLNSSEYRALESGEEFAQREENPPLGLGGLYRFFKDEHYTELLLLELEVIAELRAQLKDNGTELALELTDVRDLKHLELVFELLRKVGLEPGKDIQLGLRMDNPDNYILAREYIKQGRLSFISVIRRKLSQTYLAADRNNRHVPIDDKIAEKNLRLPINMIMQAARDSGVDYIDEDVLVIPTKPELSLMESAPAMPMESSRRQQVDSIGQIIVIAASIVIKQGSTWFDEWLKSQSSNIAVVILAKDKKEYEGVKDYEEVAYIKVSKTGEGVDTLGLTEAQMLGLTKADSAVLFDELEIYNQGVNLGAVHNMDSKAVKAIAAGV